MKVITANFLGRFGNQAMQYCFARAYAEKYGCEFQCEPWIGQEIFDLTDNPISVSLPRRSEIDLEDGETNINFFGYAQHQKCMIYRKSQVQEWFRISPYILQRLEKHRAPSDGVIAHRRGGDYKGYGYPVVSNNSYIEACSKFGLPLEKLEIISDDTTPVILNGGNLQFLPDFYRLMTATTLLRGNSTFSWFAALLSNARVFSPVIDGLEGGKEHDCEFVEGNHPKFANLGFLTDLHVQP